MILSDDTVMDHREIVTSGICSFKQRDYLALIA